MISIHDHLNRASPIIKRSEGAALSSSLEDAASFVVSLCPSHTFVSAYPISAFVFIQTSDYLSPLRWMNFYNIVFLLPRRRREGHRSAQFTMRDVSLWQYKWMRGGDNDTVIFYPFQCIEVNTEFAAVFSELWTTLGKVWKIIRKNINAYKCIPFCVIDP